MVDDAPAKWKQYKVVAEEKTPPVYTTDKPLTEFAGEAMLGHAATDPPCGSAGRLAVVSVQLDAVCDTVQPAGKTNTTLVWVVLPDFMQAQPDIGEVPEILSNITKASVAALAFCGLNNRG